MVSSLVTATLQGLGINVVDLGLSTTPTVEVMVPELKADGGIILTASHNPKQWNALKLLNEKGEFISGENGAEVLLWQKVKISTMPKWMILENMKQEMML
jgi:phosphomannomutase